MSAFDSPTEAQPEETSRRRIRAANLQCYRLLHPSAARFCQPSFYWRYNMLPGTSEEMDTSGFSVESAVRQRYGGAAQATEAALCCPVSYDRRYLEAIPNEVLE